jgi:type I restriction enzyme, S subunit
LRPLDARDLPAGWTTAAIEELFAPLEDGRTLHQGWSPQCEKAPSQTEDDWGVLKTTAIQPGVFLPEHNKRLPANLTPRPLIEVKSGDVLLTCAGPRARCGIACLVRTTPEHLMMSGKMYRFRVPDCCVDPRFLEAYLQTDSAQDAIDRMKTGISDSGLNLTHERFRQLRVLVAPFNEQRRIAAVVEEQFSRLDASVAALERVRQNLKRLRAATLQAAVTGRLTDADPTDEPAARLLVSLEAKRQEYLNGHPHAGSRRSPSQPNSSALPALPSAWVWATVDQLCTRVVDGVHKKPSYVAEGIPFVTVRNLTAGAGISFEHLNHVTVKDHTDFIRRAHPEKGDLLLSKDGTLGIVRAIREQRAFSIFVSVALLKPVSNELTDYLEIALASPLVQRQMVPKGSGLQHIHLEDLRQDCIPLPPLAQQRRIAAEVNRQISLIDELEGALTVASRRSRALRSSTLAAAFSGRLVSQDPSDEPAYDLLERITAERASPNGRKPVAKSHRAGVTT